MTRNNKIVAGLISTLVLISVSFGAYKYIIVQDYFVYLHALCVPGGDQACFVYEDGETGELSDPYVKMYRKAFEVQYCFDSGACDPFVCLPGEDDCTITVCEAGTLEEGELCLIDDEYDEIE